MVTNIGILQALVLTTLAALATGIGSLIAYIIPEPDARFLSVSLGFATGVMIFVAFVDLFYSAKTAIGLTQANIFFLSGLLLVHLLDRLIPHIHLNGQVDAHCDRLYRGGFMTTIGIGLHNFPEGLTVALVSLANLKLGIPIAIAIAIHNIPEGAACAVPLYCATRNRAKSCLYSFLAGMTEPIGAILAIIVLFPILNTYVLAASVAFVAGIMVFICFDELIPIANKYGSEHLTNIGIIAGIFVMMLALTLFE
jgi:ZIP family zinc transporter